MHNISNIEQFVLVWAVSDIAMFFTSVVTITVFITRQWRIQAVWEIRIGAPKKHFKFLFFQLHFNESSDQWFHNSCSYFEMA